MNYMLLRHPNATMEGPFVLSQIKTMFDLGQLTTQAQICQQGTATWREVRPVLAEDWERSRRVVEVQNKGRDAVATDSWQNVCLWLMGGSLILSVVPVIGILTWFVYGIVVIAVTVLAILMMTRDAVGSGIVMLVLGWIALPVGMLIFNVIGTGFFAALMGR